MPASRPEAHQFDIATASIHADKALNATPEVAPSLSVSSTYLYNKKDHKAVNMSGLSYSYSRDKTPVLSRAEAVIGAVCNGHAIAYSSGLSAMLALLIKLRPKRIVMEHGYFGSTNVVNLYKTLTPDLKIAPLCAEYRENDFVWLESPLNPTGEIKDISYYANKAHAVNAILAIDATFAPPPLCDPFKHGADVVVHSGTKYFGGHADVLYGAVITKCPKMAEELHAQRYVFGAVPGNMESWLVLRSMRTLKLRVLQQSKTTSMFVAWLANAAKGCTLAETDGIPVGSVTRVQHASLQKFSPSFDVCSQYPNGFGPVFSVCLASKEQALWVARNLKVFQFATSLGGVMSLVDWRYGDDTNQDPRLLRISIGLEDIEDLKNDFRSTIVASTFVNLNKL
ncbi:hypothetical protein BB561_004402 [Smittium simulii]|uniref:Cystathionine gamma-synthase n=1 Tax=Smittium simulii TaxID=133385 RepID=A0A2T9YGF0_9FUNG|nr:hypothetical protein BB561_004402 [Smittium simulii]